MFGGDPITRESMPPEQARAAQHEVDRWWRSLQLVGTILEGAQLMAVFSATTVRFAPGGPVIHDGPSTAEADAVGGYGLIDVEDLDEALRVAMSWPVGGFVEIRPVLVRGEPQ